MGRGRRRRLRRGFPFRDVFAEALAGYANCPTYWYVPKARALNDANVGFCARTLQLLFDEFLGATWNRGTQDALLARLSEEALLRPRAGDASIGDRTALVRIVNQLLGTLGFLWAEHDQEIVITDAGFAMIEALANDADPRPIAESQVAKLQYPHPLLPSDSREGFGGLLPHLFLLQVLRRTGGYLTFDEHEVFVNLAGAQEDVARIVRYVEHWRRLDSGEQSDFLNIVRTMPTRSVPEPGGRYRRINQDASYQRSFLCYPSYLEIDREGRAIRSLPNERMAGLLQPDIKITEFDSRADWFSYYGDPERQPSWFTYLSQAVRSAETREEAAEEIARNKDRLSDIEAAEIGRLEIEKAIETAYASQPQLLHTLEAGLRLVGRQVETPIGRIDLLCRGADGKYVVVEIKAKGAEDAVFGQILRYIGWIHGNYGDGRDNVRGIVLASQFPDKARYSRIGLLKDDAERFLRFRRHAFAGEEA